MYYHRLGKLPPKRHTQFRQPDGTLYKEEVVSSEGFSGIYSILYHIHPPTRIRKIKDPVPYGAKRVDDYALRQTHLNTSRVDTTGDDYLTASKGVVTNANFSISICAQKTRSMDNFYNNAEEDEVLFVHDDNGYLISQFGNLEVRKGDYVVIPRTVIYKLEYAD